MKPGFLLIDVLLAVTLSAVMLTSLYQSLYQTTKLTRRVESTIEHGTLLALLGNQLEKDISAAFVPLDLATTSTNAQEKKEKEPDEKLFFAEKDEHGNTKFFTCLTTTRLKVYGQEVPLVGRVVYTVTPSKTKDVYTLKRQESTNQELKDFEDKKKIRAYTILEGLKKFSIKYSIVPEEPKQEKKEEKEQKRETFEVWNQEIQEKTKRKTPDFVEITGIYHDEQQKRDHDFAFTIPVIARQKDAQKEKENVNKQAPSGPMLAGAMGVM